MRLLTLAGVILALTIPTLARAQTNGATVPAAGNVCPTSAVLNVGNSRPLIETQFGQLCVQGTVTSTGTSGTASNATSGVATSATNVPTVSYNYGWNGTTWDQLKTAPAATGTVGTGVLATGMLGFDGTNYRAAQTALGVPTSGVGVLGAGVISIFNTTPPTYTNGQYGMLQMQIDGSLRTSLVTTPFTASRTGSSNNIGFSLQGGSTTAATILATAPMLWNAATSDAAVSIGGAVVAGTGNTAVDIAPTSAAPAAIVPSISASSSATSLVAKASAGNFYDAYCQSTAAGRCIIYNSTTVPGAGALTAALVLDCAVVPAGGQGSVQYGDIPRRASTGITILFSSSADCNTYTASSTAYIHASVQ